MNERGYILHIANLIADSSKAREITRKAKKNYSYGLWYYDFNKETYHFNLSIKYKKLFHNTEYEYFEMEVSQEKYNKIKSDLDEYRKINKIEKEFYDGNWHTFQELEKSHITLKVISLAQNTGARTLSTNTTEVYEYDFKRFKIKEYTFNNYCRTKTSYSFHLVTDKKEIYIPETIPCFTEVLKKMKEYLEIKVKEKTQSAKEQKEIDNKEMLEEVQKFLSENLLATTEVKLLENKRKKELRK